MKIRILLTSFQTWLPHQQSNSSDDLLAEIQKMGRLDNVSLIFLRNLTVDIKLASQQVIAEIERVNPNIVMCCGMAEKRNRPAIESNAWCQGECLYTGINLTELSQKLATTDISHDAGKFVCEGLYYQILKYIQSQNRGMDCIFIHVPKLENYCLTLLLQDFQRMFVLLESAFSVKARAGTNIHNFKSI